VSDANATKALDPKNLKVLVYSNSNDVLTQIQEAAKPASVEVLKASDLNSK